MHTRKQQLTKTRLIIYTFTFVNTEPILPYAGNNLHNKVFFWIQQSVLIIRQGRHSHTYQLQCNRHPAFLLPAMCRHIQSEKTPVPCIVHILVAFCTHMTVPNYQHDNICLHDRDENWTDINKNKHSYKPHPKYKSTEHLLWNYNSQHTLCATAGKSQIRHYRATVYRHYSIQL